MVSLAGPEDDEGCCGIAMPVRDWPIWRSVARDEKRAGACSSVSYSHLTATVPSPAPCPSRAMSFCVATSIPVTAMLPASSHVVPRAMGGPEAVSRAPLPAVTFMSLLALVALVSTVPVALPTVDDLRRMPALSSRWRMARKPSKRLR